MDGVERGTATQPHLPLAWYHYDAVLAAEQRWLFDAGPRYAGHALMVPRDGDYVSLAARRHAQLLVRDGGQISLMSNVCRHRQALIVEGSGHGKALMCPFHRWTYRLDGTLASAPHFPVNPCLHLRRQPLTLWNGLLFEGARSGGSRHAGAHGEAARDVSVDLAGFALPPEMDFAGYAYSRTVVDEVNMNWKTFMEVYLDLYHVGPLHPGLGKFVTCDDLQWQFGERYSLQSVAYRPSKTRSAVYARWQARVDAIYGRAGPQRGAMWFAYYPNVMVEWYPLMLIVSVVYPRSPTQTTNVIEFFHPQSLLAHDPSLADDVQAAYLETAREDAVFGERIDRGRAALRAEGRFDRGPFQSPMEDGLPHFFNYLRNELRGRLPG